MTPSDLSCLLSKAKAALILFPYPKMTRSIIQQQLLTLQRAYSSCAFPGERSKEWGGGRSPAVTCRPPAVQHPAGCSGRVPVADPSLHGGCAARDIRSACPL